MNRSLFNNPRSSRGFKFAKNQFGSRSPIPISWLEPRSTPVASRIRYTDPVTRQFKGLMVFLLVFGIGCITWILAGKHSK